MDEEAAPTNLYDKYVLPHLVDWTCRQRPTMRQRQKVVPNASGVVLEIGFGTGLNAGFYDATRVERVLALEPSDEMLKRRNWREAASVLIEPVDAPAEQIPLDDESVDTVVVTYTLCTIPDVPAALVEAKRVMKKDGRLLFCEHGAAPDANVLRWQKRINPVWRRIAGGCNLDRRIPELIESAGFHIAELSTMYLPGFKPATFNYWGSAVLECGGLPPP